jgi:hypothetical protein
VKTLLNNRFAPITFEFGFIEAPVAVVADFIVQWTEGLSRPVVARQLSCALPDALQQIEPLTMPPTRQLLAETRSPWTAYFDNSVIGTDAGPVVTYVSSQLKCRGLRLLCSPNTMTKHTERGHGNYGALSFELISPESQESLSYERVVYLMNDGGRWEFRAQGTVQSFEQTERYDAKKLVDRFTSEMLADYCRAIGIHLFDESFYGPECFVLYFPGREAPGTKPKSLAEVQAKLDLDSPRNVLK